MRKLLLLSLLVVISLSACSSNITQNTPPAPTKSPEEVKKALFGLIEKKDEVENISFYVSQTTNANEDKSDVYVYFSRNSEGIISNLRFVIHYVGQIQLNISRFTINADGEMFEIKNPSTEKITSFTISQEIYDTSIFLSDLRMIKAIANADKAIVRCGAGAASQDIVLSDKQKQAMLKVLKAYKNAGGENKFYGNEL
jgi:hypothetical protein